MELPSNFNKYKRIIEWYRTAGTNLFDKYTDLFDFYCVAKQLKHSWGHQNGDIIYYATENDKTVILNQDNIQDKLANLTNEEIELALTKYPVDITLKRLKMLTISNKFNHHKIVISDIQFHKYCSYYYDVCRDFNVENFVIDIEFDEQTAYHVSVTINNGRISKPSSFKSLSQYIEVISLLGVNF